jgi:hypothetical protein
MPNQDLYVVWQEPNSRAWAPIGRLTEQSGDYTFVYLRGALMAKGFKPLPQMRDFYAIYHSDALFPVFANRLLSPSRPEYASYLQWMGISDDAPRPIQILSLSGGAKATDTMAMFAAPERGRHKKFKMKFFSQGIRYLLNESRERISKLKVGDELFPMYDFQNPYDCEAIALRSGTEAALVGYCSRYLAPDFKQFLNIEQGATFVVSRVNLDAPLQHRLLCEFRSAWPAEILPFSGKEYEPLAEPSISQVRAAG